MKKIFIVSLVFIGSIIYAQTELYGGIEVAGFNEQANINSASYEIKNNIRTSIDLNLLFDKSFFIGGDISLYNNIDYSSAYQSLSVYQISPSFNFGFKIYDLETGFRAILMTEHDYLGNNNLNHIDMNRQEIYIRYNF